MVFFIPWFSGLFLYKKIDLSSENKIDIGIVQPNITLKEKWLGNPKNNFNKLVDLSKELQRASNHLLIWPESALPAYFLQSNSFQMNKIYN